MSNIDHKVIAQDESATLVRNQQDIVETQISTPIWEESAIRNSLKSQLKVAEQTETFNQKKNAALSSREAVRLKLMLGEEQSALLLLKKSLLLERQTKNIAGESESLSLLTIVSLKLSDSKKSAIYAKQAIKKAKKVNQPDILAQAYFVSSQVFFNNQNFSSMKEMLEKALKIYREIEDITGEVETLTELAYCYVIINDRIKGRNSAQKAVSLAIENKLTRNQTFALIALGNAYQKMGEWESAMNAFYKAEKLFPKNLDFYEKAILINRIGFYYLTYGDLIQAQNYFEKSLFLFNKISRSVGSSELLSILGEIATVQENYDVALDYFEQSRVIAEKSNNPISLGLVNLNIGKTKFKSGKVTDAERYFLRSLSYYQKLGTNYRVAEVQEKLGLVYEKSGKLNKARNKYLLSLKINKIVRSKFGQAQNYYYLAKLDAIQNYRESAIQNIKESIKFTESSQGETANIKLKRNFISNVFDRYELYTNLLMKLNKHTLNKNYGIQALQIVEQSRSRSILEKLRLVETSYTADANPKTLQHERELQNQLSFKSKIVTQFLGNNHSKNKIDVLQDEIEEIESKLEEIKSILKQNSPIYSTIKHPEDFNINNFQNKVLDNNSLLLEFSFGIQESYVWLISKNSFEVFVIPKREVIDTQVDKLRVLLVLSRYQTQGESNDEYLKRIKESDIEFSKEARSLSEQLFGQFAEKLKGKRLIVVPDGKLRYFPVSALPFPNEDVPFLFTNEVVYVPSASTLNLLRLISEKKDTPKKDFLVMTDPIYTKDDDRFESKDNKADSQNVEIANKKEKPYWDNFHSMEDLNSLGRLQASREEADSILDIFGSDKSEVVTDFEANRDDFKKTELADYKVLHFATHGYLNEERPELSGIVLSKFDKSGNEQDGFIRLQDIYELKLNADLVVLSACDTGVGKEVKGEGLMSLTNGFLQTGAKTVISSRWKVSDQATLYLMKHFYKNLADENLTPSEALRKAQITMSKHPLYESPFHWAAFTVQGEYQTKLNLSRRFNYSGYLLFLSLVLVLFGVYRGYRNYGNYSMRKG